MVLISPAKAVLKGGEQKFMEPTNRIYSRFRIGDQEALLPAEQAPANTDTNGTQGSTAQNTSPSNTPIVVKEMGDEQMPFWTKG